MDNKTYGMLVVMTDLYNEAASTDIKIRVSGDGNDGFFALKDERTYNRTIYYKFPDVEATELMRDPELFDKIMREIITKANVQCDHVRIVENSEDDDRNVRYFCTACDTEMLYNGGTFEVRTGP